MVNKGIIHRNKAARHKSRLTKAGSRRSRSNRQPGLAPNFIP